MKSINVKLSGLVVLCCGLFSCSPKEVKNADFAVVPLPQEIKAVQEKGFTLNGSTKIIYPAGNEEMKQNALFLAEYIKQMTGLQVKTEAGEEGKNAIILSTGLDSENQEAYRLTVNEKSININGASAAGVFYGIQTLRKAMPVIEGKGKVLFPAVEINDYPRFSYRGAHFDVSRHFFPADSVKRFIDMLALHNINRLHWHLSDDQGWRIEIKSRPELTTIASKRTETVIGHNSGKYDGKPYGGFYTQEEARDIVEYAKKRHITVIPEIDMPGHMQAALTAYPELGCTGGPYEVWKMWGVADEVLCAGNDSTLKFIEDVLGEIVDIFPSEYINVGGDECPKVRWEKCPKCQARIKALGIKPDAKHTAEQKLQSYVITHAEKFLNQKGRQIIGWDEILEGGLAPNATVLAWRGAEYAAEAAKQKHDAILSPTSHMYFDYYQTMDVENEPVAIGGYVPIDKVYGFEPVPEGLTPEESKHIIGVQANLWTEYIPTYSQVEYMELPRMAALAEVQWCMPEKKNYEAFLSRMPHMAAIYDLQKYNYAKHIFGVSAALSPGNDGKAIDAVLSTIDGADIYYTLDGSEPTTQSEKYTDTIKIDKSCTLKAVAVRNGKSTPAVKEEIDFNKATLKPITMLKPMHKQYEFNGASTLVDGIHGNTNYKTGRWLGFQKNDMEAVIDLQEKTKIEKASLATCVNPADWVLDARKISVAVSEDGKTFKEVAAKDIPAMKQDAQNGVYKHELSFSPVEARYVKITAKPESSIPAWHGGKGNPAFIFVDEISLD